MRLVRPRGIPNAHFFAVAAGFFVLLFNLQHCQRSIELSNIVDAPSLEFGSGASALLSAKCFCSI